MLHEKQGIPVTHYFYPLCLEQQCSECACIIWLYHAYSYTVGPKKAMNGALLCEDIWTFFSAEYRLLHRKKKENAPGTMDHFSGKFLYGHVECEKLITLYL